MNIRGANNHDVDECACAAHREADWNVQGRRGGLVPDRWLSDSLSCPNVHVIELPTPCATKNERRMLIGKLAAAEADANCKAPGIIIDHMRGEGPLPQVTWREGWPVLKLSGPPGVPPRHSCPSARSSIAPWLLSLDGSAS